jgi:hypothetical protein
MFFVVTLLLLVASEAVGASVAASNKFDSSLFYRLWNGEFKDSDGLAVFLSTLYADAGFEATYPLTTASIRTSQDMARHILRWRDAFPDLSCRGRVQAADRHSAQVAGTCSGVFASKRALCHCDVL